ncbi:hypothetical protein [Methylobacter luteus]|uniref:hypothetical protein n=1 Tax=Methylobacter luteus TaxID=415 RepID=UPI0012DBD24F|nr:hypothetical protein [Methylobacter luteus]
MQDLRRLVRRHVSIPGFPADLRVRPVTGARRVMDESMGMVGPLARANTQVRPYGLCTPGASGPDAQFDQCAD